MIDKLIDAAPGNEEVPKLLEEADNLFKDQNSDEAQKIYETRWNDPGNPKVISKLLRCLCNLKI